jgi:hypothetical protein
VQAADCLLIVHFGPRFSDHSRLAILEQLLDGPRRVSDIVLATGLPSPTYRRIWRACGTAAWSPANATAARSTTA